MGFEREVIHIGSVSSIEDDIEIKLCRGDFLLEEVVIEGNRELITLIPNKKV